MHWGVIGLVFGDKSIFYGIYHPHARGSRVVNRGNDDYLYQVLANMFTRKSK